MFRTPFSRPAIIRTVAPSQIIRWCIALAVLAWLTTTSFGGSLDSWVVANIQRFQAELGNTPPGYQVMDSLMHVVSSVMRPAALIPIALLAATALGAIPWIRWRALLIPLSIGGTLLITYSLKWLTDRSRPFDQPTTNIFGLPDAAFPSAHVAISATIGFALVRNALGTLRRRTYRLIRFLTFLVIFTVGLSRIWLEAHWFTDVVGGLIAGLIGYLSAMYILGFFRYLPATY